MTAKLKIGVLDQSPIASGRTPAQALSETVQLAQAAERLGYHRYWLAEHHGSESFAGCSPEVLIAHVAAATSTIRVGSGGVMLMHYSPLKVAENFKLLQTLHPNRIDLGVGRAPGSDGLTAAALAYGSRIGSEYFPAKLADLRAFLAGSTPHTEAFAGVKAAPMVDVAPELWMLGSTEDGAQLAAHFGLPFSYAHFINPHALEQACTLYRESFRALDPGAEPVVNLGIFALCADTQEEAQAQATCRDLWRIKVEKGIFEPFPSIAEASDYTYSDSERKVIASRRENQILGTAEQVAEQIYALTGRVQADEVSIVSITHNFAARVRAYELIAGVLL